MPDNPFIGQLNRKIEIKREVLSREATGEKKPTLQIVASPYAFMQDKSGNEDVEGKVRHLISRSYTIRYNATVVAENTALKVEDNGVVYDVYHVKEIGRKKHLELLVTNYE